MIRKTRSAELDAVAAIWLSANISAHDFISPRYWKDSFEVVKGMLLEAELYVCEEAGAVQGFVGLDGDYIAGIFVRDGARSRGIGKRLLDFVKALKARLTLRVYQKNGRAIRFYQREGFAVQRESVDGHTGEKEYLMVWER